MTISIFRLPDQILHCKKNNLNIPYTNPAYRSCGTDATEYVRLFYLPYIWPKNQTQTVASVQRIYISDRRDSMLAIVLQRCDSANLSPLCLQYIQLPDRLPEQAGRGWVSHIFVRRWPVLSLLSLIYILCFSSTRDRLAVSMRKLILAECGQHYTTVSSCIKSYSKDTGLTSISLSLRQIFYQKVTCFK